MENKKYEVKINHGIWKHFKGELYETIDVVYDSKDASPMVLYRSLKDKTLWVRPVNEFFSTVKTENYTGPRFVKEK